MSHIVLDESQANVVLHAKGSVEVRDRNGKHLGYLSHGFTDEDIRIASARAASDEPCYTTEEMLKQLAALER